MTLLVAAPLSAQQPKRAESAAHIEELVKPIYTGRTLPPPVYPPTEVETYTGKLKTKAYENWRPTRESPERQKVRFVVGEDGVFKDVALINTSKEAKADLTALEAICKTSKFAKGPMRQDTVIEFTFEKKLKSP